MKYKPAVLDQNRMEDHKISRNEHRIVRGMSWITFAAFKEKERGYGGICLDMEDLHRQRHQCYKVKPYTDSEIEEVIHWVKELKIYHNIKYFGSQTYLPPGCQLYQNEKGGWVGKLLCFDW